MKQIVTLRYMYVKNFMKVSPKQKNKGKHNLKKKFNADEEYVKKRSGSISYF